MNRFACLAVLTFAIGGCAAEFGEDRAPDTDNTPASSEQTNGDPTVNVYGGQLQRPAETIGTVDEAVQTAHSRAIRNYMERVDQADLEIGSVNVRSINQ